MKEERLVDARLINSIAEGFAEVLFRWDGFTVGVLGINVGKDLLDELDHALDFKKRSKEEVLKELCRQLAETYRIADSIDVKENEEDECVEVRVENCVLLPFMKKMMKRHLFLARRPFCLINNIVMGALEMKGQNTEMRSYNMDENQCHSIIGLIEELPMEKELRNMRKG